MACWVSTAAARDQLPMLAASGRSTKSRGSEQVGWGHGPVRLFLVSVSASRIRPGMASRRTASDSRSSWVNTSTWRDRDASSATRRLPPGSQSPT
jgi:hypothetical protein